MGRWALEMAQFLKHLLCMHEVLSLISPAPIWKKPSLVAHTQCCGGGDCRSTSLSESNSSHPKKIRWRSKNTLDLYLCLLHTHFGWELQFIDKLSNCKALNLIHNTAHTHTWEGRLYTCEYSTFSSSS